MSDSVELYFTGLSIMSKVMSGDPNAIAFTLAGHFDQQLTAVVQRRIADDLSVTPEIVAMDHPRVAQGVEKIKSHIRDMVQGLFKEAARQEAVERDAKINQVLTELRNSNQPHPMGTVSQLAEKLGVSKSEIRRRRTEGTLGELLAEKMISKEE